MYPQKLELGFQMKLNIAALLYLLVLISTNVFTLSYLGTTFSIPKQPVFVDDWKRDWILFFAWMHIALHSIILILFILGGVFIHSIFFWILLLLAILFSVSILTSIFTIKYVGPSFSRKEPIDLYDWKRKWIIFFAWFGIVCSLLTGLPSLGTGNISLST